MKKQLRFKIGDRVNGFSATKEPLVGTVKELPPGERSRMNR